MPVAAFVPEAPALVPGLTGGPVGELVAVRRAAGAAVEWLLATGDGDLAIVGSGPVAAAVDVTADGVRRTLACFGAGGDAALPPALALGGWLLQQAGSCGPWPGLAVPPQCPAPRLLELASGLPSRLLVVGDGSATRDEDAPGTFRAGAIPYDDAVAAALRGGDAAALAALDPDVGTAVKAAGTGAWRLAGHAFGGQRVHAALESYDAPFGVAYLVATWA